MKISPIENIFKKDFSTQKSSGIGLFIVKNIEDGASFKIELLMK